MENKPAHTKEALALIELIKENPFFEYREIPNQGLCCLQNLLFTTALKIGLDEYSYKGRYCYHTAVEALIAIVTWDGEGDPEGNWIVYKGIGGERQNPEYKK